MGQAGNLLVVRSLRSVHFQGTIAQNAIATANLQVPGAAAGPVPMRVRNIEVISKENLAWELQFFGSAQFQVPANIDQDQYLGVWSFATADGIRQAATGYYYYYIDGLDIPIVDQDGTGQLHVALVNRSAAGKSAAAAGELVIKVGCENTYGW